jgi:hypothetical protein
LNNSVPFNSILALKQPQISLIFTAQQSRNQNGLTQRSQRTADSKGKIILWQNDLKSQLGKIVLKMILSIILP